MEKYKILYRYIYINMHININTKINIFTIHTLNDDDMMNYANQNENEMENDIKIIKKKQ